MQKRLALDILSQPDDQTCGPTCLHAVYRYHGRELPLEEVIDAVPMLDSGGTLAVLLGCHALRQGFAVRLHSYNLQVLDPTWFRPGIDLRARLNVELRQCDKPRKATAIRAYREFLSLGGEVVMVDLTAKLIRHYLDHELPILVGLSATYLYQTMREDPQSGADDDLGVPTGHFTVLHGYDRQARTVQVADPYRRNPLSGSNQYAIDIDRVLCAILLGIVTYDANLLVIQAPDTRLPACRI